MLKRKLWRDVKGNIGAYIAVITVLIIGLMLYVSMALTLDSLVRSKDNYYLNYRLADGFARITKGPTGLTEDIREITGIDRVIGRLVHEALLNRPKGDEITTLRLISFQPGQPLNKFKLETGRIPVGGKNEILVTPPFLAGNNYKIGDRIPVIIQGREIMFTITGTVNTPEYIYEIPNVLTLAPNPRTFGVAFIQYQVLAPLLNMEGQVNDLAFSLDPGTEFSEIRKQAEQFLNNYGLTSLYPVRDQLSYSMLAQEIKGLQGSVTTAPLIFLIVAASVVYIMLRRMVEHQRGQIGVLKAFGYTGWEIIKHYLGYALIIGGIGGFGGSLAGIFLSFYLVKIYQTFYNIPNLTGQFSAAYLVYGTLVSLAFSLFAGYRGCRRVMTLSPAEAMRPPSPAAGNKIFLERIALIWHMFNTSMKMAVRNVFRNKQRTFFVILGISSAFSMMVASRASFDATYFLISFQFDQVEKYDIKINLGHYVDKNQAVTDSSYLEGVKSTEPILEVPVTIKNKWLEKDLVITGLAGNSRLYQLVNTSGQTVDLPRSGLVVSNQLAKILKLKEGDSVTIKPFLGDSKEKQSVVRKIVPQYVGLGAYMQIDALSNLVQLPPVASSVLMKVQENETNEVRKTLQKGGNVAAIHDKVKMKEQFEQLMDSTNAAQYILIIFAFITGFAIVYNVNIISISERERELATLRVLGMTEKEVAGILAMEQASLGLFGIGVGIPLSYAMLQGISVASASEIFNMPIIIQPISFGISIVGTAAFLIAAQLRISGKIKRLPMLDVLKEQE